MAAIRLLRLLNGRRVARHPLRSILAVVTVAAGVSLGLAVLTLSRSVDRSFKDVGRRLAGPAPLRVVGPVTRAGLEGRVLGQVAAVPGVAAAVPTVQGVTYAERPDGSRVVVLFVGVDCRIESLLGRIGCDPTAVANARDTDPPLTSPTLVRSLGPGGFLRTATGRVPVAGAPSVASLSRVNAGRVAVFPLHAAQRIFARSDRLDAVYVKPRPGVARRL